MSRATSSLIKILCRSTGSKQAMRASSGHSSTIVYLDSTGVLPRELAVVDWVLLRWPVRLFFVVPRRVCSICSCDKLSKFAPRPRETVRSEGPPPISYISSRSPLVLPLLFFFILTFLTAGRSSMASLAIRNLHCTPRS